MSLPVVFTKELGDYIQYIKFRNQNNDGYVEWKEYLDWIVHHLSKAHLQSSVFLPLHVCALQCGGKLSRHITDRSSR